MTIGVGTDDKICTQAEAPTIVRWNHASGAAGRATTIEAAERDGRLAVG